MCLDFILRSQGSDAQPNERIRKPRQGAPEERLPVPVRCMRTGDHVGERERNAPGVGGPAKDVQSF